MLIDTERKGYAPKNNNNINKNNNNINNNNINNNNNNNNNNSNNNNNNNYDAAANSSFQRLSARGPPPLTTPGVSTALDIHKWNHLAMQLFLPLEIVLYVVQMKLAQHHT